MASPRLLDLPCEIRTHVYRCFFNRKLIQVVPKRVPAGTLDTTTSDHPSEEDILLRPPPDDKYRPAKPDTLHLLLTCRQIYNEARPICIKHAMFLLDLQWTIAPFLTARALNLRNVTIERGFIHLLPPEGSFRDMIPPCSQWAHQRQRLQQHRRQRGCSSSSLSESTSSNAVDMPFIDSFSWSDIEAWRAGLCRFVIRFDLYLYVPGKGCCLMFDRCVPYNYIPRISNAWDKGFGSNMTVEFYGRNAKGLPSIETYDPAIVLTSDGKITIMSRNHNSVEEDCLVRKMLCYLNVDETERSKCGQWDEDPTRRY